MSSFDEVLCSMVQKNPILYDKRNKFYKDTEHKDSIWRQIASSLNSDVPTCQTRFKSLQKKLETGTRGGSGSSKKVVWPMVKYMAFLDNHIQPRKTYSNFLSDDPVHPDESTSATSARDMALPGTEVMSLASCDAFESIVEEPEPEEEQPAIQATKKRCRRASDDLNISEQLRLVADATTSFTEILEKKAHSMERSFSNFLEDTLVLLPESDKLEAMESIISLLLNARRRAMQ